MKMIKTCINCRYYHGTLIDPNSDFHFHDYCSLFRTVIPSEVIFDREDCVAGYNDIECGLAVCWAFEPKKGKLQKDFPTMADNKKWSEEYESDNCGW